MPSSGPDAERATLSNISLAERAYRIRRNALRMGEVQGQGYIAQALGIADVLAVAYFHALRYRSDDPEWEGCDRFLLSCGHYAIALYAALVEAGILPEDELESYGADDSRLPMSGMAAYTPGMEATGGSLGHGLPIAVGFSLGLKRKASGSFVYNLLSDGELDEGATWETALYAGSAKLDNLIAIVDVNNMQADGPSTAILNFEPLEPKFAAFGWHAQRVDGNDIDAVIVSTGLMTMRALEAAEMLRADHVDVGVLHVPTVKPLDDEAILRVAGRSGRMVVVAENHTVIGGLGEAVAGVLLRSGVSPKFRQLGLPDEFLDAGALPTLHERYGISSSALSRRIKGWM